MKSCISCGQEGRLPVRALTVRTLHVRDLKGERRVQALGRFVDSCACPVCAERQIGLETNLWKARKSQFLGFGVTGLLGIGLILANLLVFSGQLVYTLLGVAAVLCGLLGIIQAMRDGRERKEELLGLSPRDLLEEAAFTVFQKHAPRKEGDNDLTYIPVNSRSLQRKNGDLMILYQLLPEIAMEAHRRIHQQEKDA